MIIEDIELRNIYKTASEEHLQNLEDGLLYLEKHPQDQAKLEDVLREAHTLKGDSRMLGVDSVETLIHQLEEILVAAKRGESSLSAEMCDRLYQGVDAIRKLVNEAVTGEPANVNVFYVLAQLMGADSKNILEESEPSSQIEAQTDNSLPDTSTKKAAVFDFDIDSLFPEIITTTKEPERESIDLLLPETPTKAKKPESEKVNSAVCETVIEFSRVISDQVSHQVKEPVPVSATVEAPVQPSNHQIDTIRVESQKLDTLMTQAGELTVTKIRIARRIAEIEEILSLWEEWSRDAFVNRLVLEDVKSNWQNGAIKQVQKFHARQAERLERLGILINQSRTAAYEDTARLEIVANELEAGIRTLRLLPLSTMFNLFPRMVRDLAKQQSKEVNLIIEGGETKADKRILEEMKDPLMHMLRNAIDHGIETPQERKSQGKPSAATIRLKGYQTATSIGIEIVDDGRGLDIESIKRTALRRGICSEAELATMTTNQIQSLIFASGFSTRTAISEISGRGVGLDVVRANVERLKGSIQVASTQGLGCTFHIQLDTTLATTHVLIAEVNGVAYAMPMEFVETTLLVSQHKIFTIEGRQTIAFNGQPVSVAWLADLLELQITAPASLKATDAAAKTLACIILQIGSERLGILVDDLLDEQDVVLKAQSKLLKRIRNFSGATILGTGEVCMILNPHDLLKSVRQRTVSHPTSNQLLESENRKLAILLVEDSITIRTQVKRILESAGYEVTAAVDGLDGFNKLRTGTFDAVVSDVQMPNLDGLSLAAKIRQYKEYSELPVILVTTLASDEDKRRGAEAGANAYLTKGNFDQKLLLETLTRLV